MAEGEGRGGKERKKKGRDRERERRPPPLSHSLTLASEPKQRACRATEPPRGASSIIPAPKGILRHTDPPPRVYYTWPGLSHSSRGGVGRRGQARRASGHHEERVSFKRVCRSPQLFTRRAVTMTSERPAVAKCTLPHPYFPPFYPI